MAGQQQIDFYDNFVDHFDQQKDNGRNLGFRTWTNKWITQHARILDFGCALGYNSGYLTERDMRVTGIDISPRCIEIAKQRYPRGDWICADVTATRDHCGVSKLTEPVSFIFMSDVIEHVPILNHDNMFSYLNQNSAPGAAILASIPNPEYHEESLRNTPQPVEEKINIPELLGVMANNGFDRIVSLFLDGKLYYRMVVQKSEV